jgi:co-chaperonin GroES (HSP10)
VTTRAYADNVIIVLEPLPTETASGIALVNMGRNNKGHRTARVIASGPGYTSQRGVFIPNETRAGDRVIVDALAGQHYQMDLTVPRHNKTSEFQELFGEKGEWRIVREQEILGVLEDEAKAAE